MLENLPIFAGTHLGDGEADEGRQRGSEAEEVLDAVKLGPTPTQLLPARQLRGTHLRQLHTGRGRGHQGQAWGSSWTTAH